MSRIFCVATLLVLSFACSAAVADWYSVVQDAGPYAWWQLNETEGTTAFDAMGNYHGTYKNSPTLGVAGPRPPAFIYMPQDEYAVNFAKTNAEYVELDGLGSFGSNLATTGFTYEAWLRTESTGTDVFFGLRHQASSSEFIQMRLADSGRALQLRLRDASLKYLELTVPRSAIEAVTGSNVGIRDGEWHHLGVSFNVPDEEIFFVLNGVPCASALSAESGFYATGIRDFDRGAIGAAWDAAALFDGDIAQTVLYNKVLTVEQLQAHYEAAIPEPGTLLLLAVGGVAMLLARRRRR